MTLEAAKKVYVNKYQGKTVQWSGHVMRIDGNENNFLHQAKVLIVMKPRDLHPVLDEYAQREPDLIISFDLHSFNRNKEVLEGLKRGDFISFNATITHLAQKRPTSNQVSQ